ncbi:MAG: FAD-binding protein [Ignavibacteriota bacterium]
MRRVEVDLKAKTATIGGGALGSDVSAATTPHGLAAVTANVGVVGMAGFLLGGGYGPLTSRFGLGVDNLMGAEVVLADGRRVWADASQNEELFWALRGGGGNFGVVTFHEDSPCIRWASSLAGLIMFPWTQAETVLHGFAEILASAPNELSMLAVVLPMPDGSPAMFLGPIWSGSQEEGKKVMAQLQDLGSPILTQIAPLSYSELLGIYDFPGTQRTSLWKPYTLVCRTLFGDHIGLDHGRLLADVAALFDRPFTTSTGLRRSCRPGATAFGMRRPHFRAEIVPRLGTEFESGRRRPSKMGSGSLVDIGSSRTAWRLRELPGGGRSRADRLGLWTDRTSFGRTQAEIRPDNVFSSATPLPA